MTAKLGVMATLVLAMAAADASDGKEAADDARWMTSWYAAPQPAWDDDFILPMNVPRLLNDQSLRETVRLSAGGKHMRLVFSNRYGRQPVRIGAVRAGPADGSAPALALTFSGAGQATIPPGAVITSDPVALAMPPLSRLTVSSYLPSPTPVTGFHWGAQQTVQVTAGNAVAAPRFAGDTRVEGRLFLQAVLVEAQRTPHTVVVLGDSITDGNGSTQDADRRWPDMLAQRLAPDGIAVANAGISGGRLLRDGMGRSALARFEQDVLAQPGVAEVIVLLGTNDIGWPGGPFAPAERAVTVDELANGYRQLLAAAHARGVRVTAGTLPPFEGALEGTPFAGHYSPEKERLRKELNRWIRNCGLFDAVVDFDAVLRDPDRPQRLRKAFDSGDHLHPGDAGYRAMAAAVDVAAIKEHLR